MKRELAAEHDTPLNPPPIWPPTASVNSNSRGNGPSSSAADDPDACGGDGAEQQFTVAIPEANQKNGIHAFNARRAAQVLHATALAVPLP